MKNIFNRAGQSLIDVAPLGVLLALATGNTVLALEHGYHADLVTAAGLSWLGSDISVAFKNAHPVSAPRVNATLVTLGALFLAASGVHAAGIDWPRVLGPLTGTLPAAMIVGFRHEIHQAGQALQQSAQRGARAAGAILRHPYAVAAGVNAYFGLREMWASAQATHDPRLVLACKAYAIGTAIMPLLDGRSRREQQVTI